jgi:hypothetical protein
MMGHISGGGGLARGLGVGLFAAAILIYELLILRNWRQWTVWLMVLPILSSILYFVNPGRGNESTWAALFPLSLFAFIPYLVYVGNEKLNNRR